MIQSFYLPCANTHVSYYLRLLYNYVFMSVCLFLQLAKVVDKLITVMNKVVLFVISYSFIYRDALPIYVDTVIFLLLYCFFFAFSIFVIHHCLFMI